MMISFIVLNILFHEEQGRGDNILFCIFFRKMAAAAIIEQNIRGGLFLRKFFPMRFLVFLARHACLFA